MANENRQGLNEAVRVVRGPEKHLRKLKSIHPEGAGISKLCKDKFGPGSVIGEEGLGQRRKAENEGLDVGSYGWNDICLL